MKLELVGMCENKSGKFFLQYIETAFGKFSLAKISRCTVHEFTCKWYISSGCTCMHKLTCLLLHTHLTDIQVFDIQQARAREVSTVHALFSVARVRWRPGQRSHITRWFFIIRGKLMYSVMASMLTYHSACAWNPNLLHTVGLRKVVNSEASLYPLGLLVCCAMPSA